jgi:pimeloyl-ACP methyl ester carboxylesterase
LRPSTLILAGVLLLSPVLVSANVERGEFKAGKVKLHYEIHGTGEPLILLNGILGSAEKTWGAKANGGFGLYEALSKRYRVIALDGRGQGKSDKPHDPKMYGMETVRDVIRLMDHLKIRKAHVLGLSMGGGVLGRLLVERPERLLSAILVSPRMVYKLSREEISGTAELIDALKHKEKRANFILKLVPPDQPKPTVEQAAAIADGLLKDEDALALAAWAEAHDRDLGVSEKQLRANRVPVLVVYASKEAGNGGKEWMEEIASLLRGEVKVIEGAEHGTSPGFPAFLEAVTRFLDKHQPSK